MISIDLKELAEQKKLLPLAFFVGGSTVVYHLFKQPALRDSIFEYRLWNGWGIVVLLTGAWLALAQPPLSETRRGQRGKRQKQAGKAFRLRKWGPAMIGVLLLALGHYLKSLPFLPNDRIVVTILEFTPISEGYSTQASNYSDQLYRALHSYADGGALRLKRLPERVGLVGDERARRDSAVALGRTRSGAAHLVLWGDIFMDDDSISVHARLTGVVQTKQHGISDLSMEPFSFGSEDHLIFSKWTTEDIASLVPLVLGWGYLQNGNPTRAIAILSNVHTDQGKLLLAHAYRNRFVTASHPLRWPGLADLRRAVALYESISGPKPWSAYANEVPWITLTAGFERAEVLNLLSSHDEAGNQEERANLLAEAIASLESLARIHESAARPHDQASVYLELAVLLGRYSEMRPLGADTLLQRSWDLLQASEQLNPRYRVPPVSTHIESVRCAVILHRGIHDTSDSGTHMIREALDRCMRSDVAMRSIGQDRPSIWFNIAHASEVLGHRTTGARERRLHFERSLTYYSRIYEYTRARRGTQFEIERDRKIADDARKRITPLISGG